MLIGFTERSGRHNMSANRAGHLGLPWPNYKTVTRFCCLLAYANWPLPAGCCVKRVLVLYNI